MSLHYLLDGYNILHQLKMSGTQKFSDEREAFLHMIEIYKPQGSVKNKVTVVFDGRSGLLDSRSSSVEIIFSLEKSADDKIKAIVEQADNKKRIVVVTDDRDIQYSVRAQGARVLSVDEFLSKLKAKRYKATTSRGDGQTQSAKNISKSMEYQITSELEEFWLKKKKGHNPKNSETT